MTVIVLTELIKDPKKQNLVVQNKVGFTKRGLEVIYRVNESVLEKNIDGY